MKNNQEGDFQSKNLSKQNVEEQQLEKQKQTLKQTNKELNKGEAKNSSENLAHTLRLDALNLKIDPKNPERKPWRLNGQSVVNGINALDDASSNLVKNSKWLSPITVPLAIAALPLKIIPTIAKATAYTAGGVANSAKKVGNFFKKDYFKTKPNDFGDWDARKENIEKQAKMLGELKETGELLKEIEKNLTKNGALNKAEFAKSAVNILSNKENKDLLKDYLKEKGVSDEEIKTAITAVNSKKHILLTGKGWEDFKATKTEPEERKKEFIEFFKTKGETNLMSDTEIEKTTTVLEKDFGFTLSDAGTIEYKKPDYQNENYQKELKTANNIYEKLEEKVEGKFDYAVQNKELEEQKAKEKAKEEENNKNYSRTSTGETQQSGMSTSSKIGNAAVLGGAIASAAVIPFVGWIVALAILYSFKDKFKDNPKAEEDLYKDVAQGLTKNGKSEKEAEEKINELKKEIESLKNKEKNKEELSSDEIITKDLGGYLNKNPSGIEKIQQIFENQDSKNKIENFQKFIKTEVYRNEPSDKQKEAIKNLGENKLEEITKLLQQNQANVGDEGGNKNQIFQKAFKSMPGPNNKTPDQKTLG